MNRLIIKITIIIAAFLVIVGLLISKRQPCVQDHSVSCWQKELVNAFERKGLAQALDLIDHFYQSDPAFAQNCHNFGHLLGTRTYDLFAKGESFSITPKTAFCSYGFYHGLMEVMAAKRGDVTEAREFCHYVDDQLKDQTPDASLQCFHGIGHGWVNAHDRPNAWGNDVAMSVPALDLCRQVTTSESELSRCATGVFNGIAVFYTTGEYGLSLNQDDPIRLCHEQADPVFADACYLSMNLALMSLTQGDFIKASSYLDTIIDPVMKQHAMINLAILLGVDSLKLNRDHQFAFSQCRQVSDSLQVSCLQGYAYSFLEHGEPGREYQKSLAVCEDAGLTKDESDGCFSYIFGYLAQWYPKDKAISICQTYPADLNNFCQSRVNQYE